MLKFNNLPCFRESDIQLSADGASLAELIAQQNEPLKAALMGELAARTIYLASLDEGLTAVRFDELSYDLRQAIAEIFGRHDQSRHLNYQFCKRLRQTGLPDLSKTLQQP